MVVLTVILPQNLGGTGCLYSGYRCRDSDQIHGLEPQATLRVVPMRLVAIATQVDLRSTWATRTRVTVNTT
jgi:hypothetical protein